MTFALRRLVCPHRLSDFARVHKKCYIAMARMEDRQGGNLVPMAGEVRHHSSKLKILKKKFPINIEPPYKYTMQQYILEKHIKNKSRHICMHAK
jgi:hypothetical protein